MGKYDKFINQAVLQNSNKPFNINRAIQDGGFYWDDHVWNSIVYDPKSDRIYRHSVETLIFKDNMIFVCFKQDGTYYLPGGSTEPGVVNEVQCQKEAMEEARLNITNVNYTGVTFIDYTIKSWWVKQLPVLYSGKLVEIYVADYLSNYTGYIKPSDRDEYCIKNGKFYPLSQVWSKLSIEHKKALNQYHLVN